MRVGQSGNSTVQGNEAAEAKKTGRAHHGHHAHKAKDAEGAESAKAEISDRGRELARAKQAALSAPEVREEKIAELRKRIQSGQYKVDAKAVADKMVEDHLGMHGMD